MHKRLRLVVAIPATRAYLGLTVVVDADPRPCRMIWTCPDFIEAPKDDHWHIVFTTGREDGVMVRGARTQVAPPTVSALQVTAKYQSSKLTKLRRSI